MAVTIAPCGMVVSCHSFLRHGHAGAEDLHAAAVCDPQHLQQVQAHRSAEPKIVAKEWGLALACMIMRQAMVLAQHHTKTLPPVAQCSDTVGGPLGALPACCVLLREAATKSISHHDTCIHDLPIDLQLHGYS